MGDGVYVDENCSEYIVALASNSILIKMCFKSYSLDTTTLHCWTQYLPIAVQNTDAEFKMLLM